MEIKIKVPDIEGLPFIKLVEKSIIIAKNNNQKITRFINILIEREPGIYFLYNKKKELLYIGETSSLLARLSIQRRETPEAYYTKFFILHETKRYRIGVEQLLIHIFKPKLLENTTLPNNPFRLIKGQ